MQFMNQLNEFDEHLEKMKSLTQESYDIKPKKNSSPYYNRRNGN